MSHFTTIQTQVRDLDALRLALGELGVSLREKTNARGYAGNQLTRIGLGQFAGFAGQRTQPVAQGTLSRSAVAVFRSCAGEQFAADFFQLRLHLRIIGEVHLFELVDPSA